MEYSILHFKILFPRNKYGIGFTKKTLFQITLHNGMKVKTDSGCSLIEYDIYFKESEI